MDQVQAVLENNLMYTSRPANRISGWTRDLEDNGKNPEIIRTQHNLQIGVPQYEKAMKWTTINSEENLYKHKKRKPEGTRRNGVFPSNSETAKKNESGV